MKKITKKTYLEWYENMYFWRKFEDKLAQVYIKQKVRGFLHLYNGQEAILAGALHVMDLTKDKMITAYRNHVQPIGMGVDPKKVMAELYGKSTGTSSGLGGSMHIFSKEHGFYGGHGIVGGQIPLGAGLAFADKYFNKGGVTLTFMGDGAMRQGSLHETMNLAMLWNLPVVFCVENNGYAMGTSVERTANHTEIWKMGLAYDMPCKPVDGMKPEVVAEALDEAIKRARSGNGPTFLEIRTYRYRGHSMSDAQHYRTKKEVSEKQEEDPISYIKSILLEKKYATEEQINEIDQKVKHLVAECEQFAEDSPYPEKNVMYDVVYEQEDYPFLSHKI
ncbi:MAG: pyruvate dehydrogenase (acetyl-transferring) E1 component subunit alpha [Flavobacteriales bacterium]|jgi:pyruvate dehydrogenase E1 component alpha subunit|nr:pyruvate dehydrogenase (acetyl-transferring) E1 component subunit alpha [Flavobacteriaceae bacterium]MDG2447678.1 pyruvate dehydrogenase (acetyl-transferring) E1 component subunit alpha [Flavobacteriaceae bacterium]RZP15547.1 MAG: pyruvate dehydrogenase (acetyl-transferring) E1 component subunit alpha [Flavobacteriales bacterium]|tara:strand:- start:452 stop:1450 length:999 start_codon:yes stop_codon:yes gene_type:complete